MENAGRATVDVLERLEIGGAVLILCGKGNNAGDGFVIARHLALRGYAARVVLLARGSELRGDARLNLEILRKCAIPIDEIPASDSEPGSAATKTLLDSAGAGAEWIVDALLGTGATGEPRPPFDAAIEWMNSQSCKRLAVDIPSGLDCDTGIPSRNAVRADHTCTYAAMKVGFDRAEARDFTGEIHCCDIGIPPEWIREVAGPN